ncbi:large subunit ribosomal protein L10 [Anaerobranca californiensis DSM 14826]|jgi:large subunit ribosomal protein L10|uniref:Large ribosomal subunit protein uL10 n=1 Tax=Anaerobranca californiensis DSM 14826 TaxID=1120989 RepID=A0A1M6RGB1_9FIRM|nr:50S ribosomal protein L10 [Anaerobranca californiensis]SHK31504.1 large subunit ribosomal protein L10 [Anaerobranca californiensis DSM 14826]
MGAREEKALVVAELKEKFGSAQAAIITDYRGLDVARVTKLRAKLREAGVEYKVIKNTLAKLAVQDTELSELQQHLQGPTAVAFSYNDPVAAAKIISEFAKDNKELEIKAGILEGKVIDLAGVKALADLPSREVLIAQVLAGIQAPITGFVNVMQGNVRNLVYVLEAIRKQKEA